MRCISGGTIGQELRDAIKEELEYVFQEAFQEELRDAIKEEL